MSVIPLTLTISLCLVFTFVLFFLREHSRHRFSSAESDALLPLADETPRLANAPGAGAPRSSHHHGHRHDKNDPCGCRSGTRPPCHGCLKATDDSPGHDNSPSSR